MINIDNLYNFIISLPEYEALASLRVEYEPIIIEELGEGLIKVMASDSYESNACRVFINKEEGYWIDGRSHTPSAKRRFDPIIKRVVKEYNLIHATTYISNLVGAKEVTVDGVSVEIEANYDSASVTYYRDDYSKVVDNRLRLMLLDKTVSLHSRVEDRASLPLVTRAFKKLDAAGYTSRTLGVEIYDWMLWEVN